MENPTLGNLRLRYYMADSEKQILYTYYGAVYLQKLKEFLNSLPKNIKEKTFPILELYRIDGKITSNFERHFGKEEFDREYYHILEYNVEDNNVENKEFFSSEEDCNTKVYDIYIKWEEDPEITKYCSRMEPCIMSLRPIFFDMDFSLIYQLLTEVSSSEEERKFLFDRFMNCFAFSEVDQCSFEEVQIILDAENIQSLKLKELVAHLKRALKNGIKNQQFFHPNRKENTQTFEMISSKNENEYFLEMMAQEKNALGRYVNATKDFETIEVSSSFYLNCISDEGDLYTYRVLISLPTLYQFMMDLNQNYKIQKERTFDELDWDCYKNEPIITNYLDKDLIENNGYQIVEVKVKKENIHIRTQKAESVYVRWEENVDLIRFINNLIASLIHKPEVDLSVISEKVDSLPVDEQQKKRIYYAFFKCFQFGKPVETIPSTLISAIENYATHTSFNLEKQKLIIKRKKELGIRNRELFALLLESGIVDFSNSLIFRNKNV